MEATERVTETGPAEKVVGRGKHPNSRANLKQGPAKPKSGGGETPQATGEPVSLLEDMRHVRSRPKSADTTEGHRDCRRWKTKDLKGFLAKLAELEKAAYAPRGAGKEGGQGEGAPDVGPPDEGAGRALELIDRLLGEWEQGHADRQTR